MKNVGNSSDGRSQGVPKISGHPCIGRMGALRGHLCDSTVFLFFLETVLKNNWRRQDFQLGEGGRATALTHGERGVRCLKT